MSTATNGIAIKNDINTTLNSKAFTRGDNEYPTRKEIGDAESLAKAKARIAAEEK